LQRTFPCFRRWFIPDDRSVTLNGFFMSAANGTVFCGRVSDKGRINFFSPRKKKRLTAVILFARHAIIGYSKWGESAYGHPD
jgi:hypothetical protein